jgi:hypothetical protein
MKKIFLTSLFVLFLINGCAEPELEDYSMIDLGVTSKPTLIKSVKQTSNEVKVVFSTTTGAKYSVQILPFGNEVPVIVNGFTATSEETQKEYNLNGLPKGDYDLILIDIKGDEIKTPLIIK